MSDQLFTDQGLIKINLLKLIEDESTRQIEKWGIQKRTAFEWLTYTAEELGELAEAISEHAYRGGSRGDVIKEAIQGATLLVKIAEMFMCEETRGGQ